MLGGNAPATAPTPVQWASYGSCLIKRVRGRSVPIFGIQQTAWDAQRGKKDTDEAKMIAELNMLLESRRTAVS